jgi:hypothetical protein
MFEKVNIIKEPEGGFSQLLYDALAICKNHLGFPLFVFLDRMCLNDGKNWEKGFVKGLLNSKVIILVASTKVHFCNCLHLPLMFFLVAECNETKCHQKAR